MSGEIKNIGSKWWKFDFHTHSPKSNDYGRGDATLKTIRLEDWLRKAMEAELDCVVLTDHNSGEWIDVLKAKNKELRENNIQPDWYRDLTIFPGVEITVADSSSRVHLLAVFDPSCDSQKITAVLGGCGITEGFGDDNQTSTNVGFIDTVKKIVDAGGVAILAHIDGAKGLLENATALTPELEKSLKGVFAAEFCDLYKFDNAETSLKKAVDRLAKVAGSDAHKPDEIGRYSSWLKMSTPSIEGLRLALMDHEFCVKNQESNPNHKPDIFLSELVISSMRHCGRVNGKPLCLPLHPHFNAIIGGRGTGKSTVLESTRIVSRRDIDLEAEAPRLKEDLDRFMKLSQHKGVMLNDTEILLSLHRRGKDYQLCWRQDGEGPVLKENTGSGWNEIEAGNLKERFPISIFSQKQINELASNPRGLLEVVDRTPDVNRPEWKSRWESVKSEILQLRERRREFLRQLSEEQSIRTKLGDVENDLKQYEEQGHGEILKQYQKRSQQKNSLPDSQLFDDLSARIRETATMAEFPGFPENLFDEQDETSSDIRAIHENTAAELKKCKEALLKIADQVESIKTKRTNDIAKSKWQVALQSSIDGYESLVKEYEEKKSQLSLSLYGEWVQQRNQLQEQLNKLAGIKKEKDEIERQIDKKFEVLETMRSELLEKRRAFIDKVIGSSAFVRMELIQYGDISSLEGDYRNILSLDGDKFRSSILDRDNQQGILWDLYNWESNNSSQDQIRTTVTEIKKKTLKIALGEDAGNHGAFDTRLKKAYETQPAMFDQLDTWWPEDLLRVKYSKDPSSGKFEDLEKGSAGQKAAAILAFLLSHGNEPLIIDQPEDDLDNALIYDLIVKQIHENKNRRQLIIVTHNPNIVVNGDAEVVHVLKFINGQVHLDLQGGLEELNIRDAICTIMEGGRQAFDKRYKRITLELDQ
jgi:predicted metal-dependent phosphoesterase TrpH/predicted ATPase